MDSGRVKKITTNSFPVALLHGTVARCHILDLVSYSSPRKVSIGDTGGCVQVYIPSESVIPFRREGAQLQIGCSASRSAYSSFFGSLIWNTAVQLLRPTHYSLRCKNDSPCCSATPRSRAMFQITFSSSQGQAMFYVHTPTSTTICNFPATRAILTYMPLIVHFK